MRPRAGDTYSAASCPGPAPGILRILDRPAGPRQQQRAEGVDHDSRLVRGGAALVHALDDGLHGTGLRPVRETGWVQRYRADPDARPLAGRVVAADVIHHLVGVHVVVVVRDR